VHKFGCVGALIKKKAFMTNSNIIVENQLDNRLMQLAKEMSADALSFCGPIYSGIDELIRDAIENMKDKRDKLVIVLETPGGYIEVAKRIVDTVRHHFGTIEFIVPNHAMSAGTVLVMSGDAIFMDYFSVLGPIDPQIERPDGTMVPGLGYLIKYDRLIGKSKAGKLTTAELHYLVERFDPAELYSYEQARELSIAFLKEWLVKYKFKNWEKTATRNKTVTRRMKVRRAAEIARRLNDTDFWHSHGHGISMEVLRREINLQIEDFGANVKLSEPIRSYHRLLVDYMGRRGHKVSVHVKGSFTSM
jgi:hypothetical protein